jgi:hypothetical protein
MSCRVSNRQGCTTDRTWQPPRSIRFLEQGKRAAVLVTGAAAAFVVMFALCQSPVRNLGRDQAQEPSFPTGLPTTPPSLPSCGWLCPTPSSSCATARLAAATTASLAVECRPIRPVRAATPRKTIRTATGTTTIIPASGPATGVAQVQWTIAQTRRGYCPAGPTGTGLS